MNAYYQLKDQAHRTWMEAQTLIDRAEYLYDHGKIDATEWSRMLADVLALQDKAMELEKSASRAQVVEWREQYAEFELQAADWSEQHITERP